jgi:Mg2+-importing ATPase
MINEMAEMKLPREAEMKSEIKPQLAKLGQYPHPFWSMPWKHVLGTMKSSEEGLKRSEVTARLMKHGKNEIREEHGNQVTRLLLSQVMSPIIYVLFAAAIVSFFLNDIESAAIIAVIILINAMLGFIQEYRAEKAVEKLKKYLSYTSTVFREGKMALVDSSEVVPGDIVELTVGDRVPADMRLISAENMSIDESVLTGEYYPVQKTHNVIPREHLIPQDMVNMAFAGSMVKEGKGRGVVVATGTETYFGQTALSFQGVEDESHFQIELKRFGGMLLRIILIGVAFVFLMNTYLDHGPVMSLLFAATLAVGLVPEPLPLITTLLFARGASKMADSGVIVKRLSATEDLGNVDILCTDKTGTLTENRISVADSISADGKKDETPLILALQCHSATVQDHQIRGNPIDVALLQHARKFPHLRHRSEEYERVQELPFDYERKRMSMVVRLKGHGGKNVLICKGAPEAVLAASTRAVFDGRVVDIGQKRKQIMEQFVALSESGYRAVAVAIKEVRKQDNYTKSNEKDLTFIGFVTLIDPPKEDAKATLELAKKYGVSVKILTGDGPTVTRAIAEKVGFVVSPEQVLSSSEIDEMIEKKDVALAESAVIFARVTPEQKLKVIRLLRSCGHVVAYIGDGVNDAPSLAAADVGISVSNGTDVAKEAAEVVLTRKDLGSVVEGIIIGRGTFANIMKYLRCMFVGNFGNYFTIALTSAFLPFLPMLPAQILLVNFLADTPLISLSTDNVDPEELQTPRRWKIGQLVRNGLIFGAIGAVFNMIVVLYVMNYGASLFRSVLFLEMVFAEVFVILALRTIKPAVLSNRPSLTLLAVIIAIVVVGIAAVSPLFAGTFGFETPVTELVLFALLVAIGYALTTEVAKYIVYRHFGQEKETCAVPVAAKK